MSLLEDYFTERCVFSGIEKRDGDKLMNISSGLVAPANVNVDVKDSICHNEQYGW